MDRRPSLTISPCAARSDGADWHRELSPGCSTETAVVRPTGFEPVAFGFVDRRSIQLSYERTRRISIPYGAEARNRGGMLAEKPGFEPGNELYTR